MMNSRPSLLMQAATSMVSDTFNGPSVNSPFTFTGQPVMNTTGLGVKWLFPQPEDVDGVSVIQREDIKEHEWFDAGLNLEQRVSYCPVFIFQG